MKRGNDQTIALIARKAQGIGSGLHPESDFENTSKLFICAGNKNSGAVFCLTRKPLRAFSPLFASCLRTYIKKPFRCRNTTGNQTSRVWIKTQKRFIFAEKFIRDRNGSKVIPMTNDIPNVNRTQL
jgi:hypothetical protein